MLRVDAYDWPGTLTATMLYALPPPFQPLQILILKIFSVVQSLLALSSSHSGTRSPSPTTPQKSSSALTSTMWWSWNLPLNCSMPFVEVSHHDSEHCLHNPYQCGLLNSGNAGLERTSISYLRKLKSGKLTATKTPISSKSNSSQTCFHILFVLCFRWQWQKRHQPSATDRSNQRP